MIFKCDHEHGGGRTTRCMHGCNDAWAPIGDPEPMSPPETTAPTATELPSHVSCGSRYLLTRWANRLCGRYGEPVYLVGSALREDNPDPRDWDVRITLDDADFAIRFGSVADWIEEGRSGQWTRTRWRWSEQCVKDSKDFAAHTHLNGDVQIYPASHVATRYANEPRVRLDSFPEPAPVARPPQETNQP